ncbi:MAG: calcium/sodium antiporter [Blautia sp.]|nr:calcium/sodium antiporter [Blautia sp.]
MTEFMETCSLPLAIVFLIIGFVLLIKGADCFVEGSSSIAKRFHVPSIIIGLTIVAMGTSLPETSVSVTASISNNNALAVSNAVGSNIFNLMVVIGACAILTPVLVQREVVRRDIPFSVICAILLLVLGFMGPMSLGHLDGAILLACFIGFIAYMIRKALAASRAGAAKDEDAADADAAKLLSLPKSIFFIILGVAGIAIGGDVVVSSASNIAVTFGMSQTLVGLTIVSIGTSLPELVTSVVAARKNEVDMALGNAIGSNIFNILMVLGVASAISPIAFLTENIVDICVLIAFSVLVWIFAATKKQINKAEGFVMVALYAAYVVYACIR